jgi:LysW-gamma-L-lysine/LysW-L-ornithine aminotransferase
MPVMMENESRFSFDVYPRRDLILVRGDGARLWDDAGRTYIDCIGGHGTASVGHCNEKVADAIARQARRLISCPGTFYNDQRALLLETLIDIAPRGLNRAFFCNSGTESVEAALKFARYTTGRTGFVCAMRGFHGRTMGALSATYNPASREDFFPLVPGFEFVPFNNLDRLAAAINEDTAAVVLEAVQGEGGVHVARDEYLRGVRSLCDERGVLLIIDEVQTGFFRTGRFFAVDHFDVVPDMMCLAKAMAGGVPMGAVLCSDRIDAPIGKHGSTFGGNPLACAAALAAIGEMKEHDLAAQAAEKGDFLMDMIRRSSLKKVRDVRGLGLMIGIELRVKVKPVLLQLMEAGVLALPAGSTVLRLLPPLTIGMDDLEEVGEVLAESLP